MTLATCLSLVDIVIAIALFFASYKIFKRNHTNDSDRHVMAGTFFFLGVLCLIYGIVHLILSAIPDGHLKHV